jgi:hypothetical protein
MARRGGKPGMCLQQAGCCPETSAQGKGMNCPECGLINPPGSSHCDCGYDFLDRKMPRDASPGRAEQPTGRPCSSLAFVRVSAVCFLVVGVPTCHDALVPPASRFVPGLAPALMLAGPFLIVLGVVLLVGSFLPSKAAKPMVIVGISLTVLGGLPFVVPGLIELFLFVTLPFVLMPGLALAAAGGVLASVRREQV